MSIKTPAKKDIAAYPMDLKYVMESALIIPDATICGSGVTY